MSAASKDKMAELRLPDKFELRLITPEDYDRGFFDLLAQLTVAPKVDREIFLEIIADKNIQIYVVEDKTTKKLVATMRLNYERKLIRNGGIVCHFEDFVVDEAYRKDGLGSFMVRTSRIMARDRGCYKMLGICADSLMPFYEKQGHKRTGFVFGTYFCE